jgi:cytochrome bd-type quinol oxidase subunit 2
LADIEPGPRRSDRSPWNWLLIVPVVVPLLTFWFNRDRPRLAGFPFFYWMQFGFIILGVGCTTIVYLMTRRTTNGAASSVSSTTEKED